MSDAIRRHEPQGKSDTALTSRAHTAEVLAGVAAAIGETLDLWSVELWTVAYDREGVVCRASWGKDGGTPGLVGASVGLRQSVDIRRLVLAGEAIEHHIDDPDLSTTELAALQQRGLCTRLDAPLLIGDDVLGLVSVTDTRYVRRFSAGERDAFAGLCRLAAAVLLNTDLYQRALQRDERLLGLLRSSRVRAAAHDVLETVTSTRDEVARLLPDVRCATEIIVRQDEGAFARIAGAGARGAEARYEPHRADALARQAVVSGEPQQSRVGDDRVRLVLPLPGDEQPGGYVELTAHLPRRFTQEEVQLLLLLADQAAAGLDNARVIRTLQRRSATDPVTNVYSAWYFAEHLEAEVARARRYQHPLTVILVDLDDLPRFRAERGSAAADTVLQGMARIVAGCMRKKVDIVCRHRDAAFAVLLPDTPAREAGGATVAERMRQLAAETELRDDELGRLGRFALSVGVAGFPSHGDDAEELLGAAEAALRAARGGAQGRVVLYSELR